MHYGSYWCINIFSGDSWHISCRLGEVSSTQGWRSVSTGTTWCRYHRWNRHGDAQRQEITGVSLEDVLCGQSVERYTGELNVYYQYYVICFGNNYFWVYIVLYLVWILSTIMVSAACPTHWIKRFGLVTHTRPKLIFKEDFYYWKYFPVVTLIHQKLQIWFGINWNFCSHKGAPKREIWQNFQKIPLSRKISGVKKPSLWPQF